MAKNLRAKIPKNDKLIVYDRNIKSTTKFLQEVGIAASNVAAEEKGINIEVVGSPREVAQKSVGGSALILPLFQSSDEHVLSMI